MIDAAKISELRGLLEKAEGERDNARADNAWLAKRLIRLREALNNIAKGAEDEGDRVYFGSTNDADWLKEIARDVDAYAFDRITRESKWPDYIETSRLAHERLETAETHSAALARALEELSAKVDAFWNDPERPSVHRMRSKSVHELSDAQRRAQSLLAPKGRDEKL